MKTSWSAKFYLLDIIEAQKWDINELAIEAGIQIDELERLLDKNTEVYFNEELDRKICLATNQPIGYFLEIDKEYKKYNK